MALTAGTRIGPYEVTAWIGAGGMGEVYRATDTNLKRSVAIKILPETLAGDAEHLARFQREAEVLAALNHPNIAHIHGLERSRGTTALVMELVEGPTLADRLAQGALPIDEALPIAKQIAEGLEAAHERGIVHRDLKPANVKVRSDGTVKVLDFGLAKAIEPTGGAPASQTMSPTITTPAMTQAGLILGTAAYMSPEQVKGKLVDRRSDVWAFGVLLYEMLTGRRAFEGDELSTTLARVIEREPDWALLPASMPPVLASFLRRCLVKDPRQRIHDIADVRLAIDGAFDATPVEGVRSRRGVVPMLATFLAGVAVAIAVVGLVAAIATGPSSGVDRLGITLPENLRLTRAAETMAVPAVIAPDGRHVVYSVVEEGRTRLYRRDLDDFDAQPIEGTDGGTSPFFSPDGEWLGFFASGSFWKVRTNGGPPVSIASVPTFGGTGVDWGADGWIRFTASSLGSGLWQVPAAGGTPEMLTAVNSEGGEYAHAWPQLLPDGRHVLFTLWGPTGSTAVLNLESREWRTILDRANGARYLPTGHLAFEPSARPNQWDVVPFDVRTLQIRGTPVPVLEDLNEIRRSGRLSVSVSANGTLAYVPAANDSSVMVWVDRDGRASQVERLEPDRYEFPSLSPDGTRLAFQLYLGDVWFLDLRTGTRTRHSIRGGGVQAPLWSPDGATLFFSSNRRGAWNLYGKPAGAPGEAQRLVEAALGHFPVSSTADGSILLLRSTSPDQGDDIYVWQDDELKPLLATSFNEKMPKLSPNGRYLAYISNESGQQQVYVTTFPDPSAVRTISTDGGTEPLWSPDGRELFYRQGRRVMVVDVETGDDFTASAPRTLFEGDYTLDIFHDWDIAPDGQRFVMVADRPPLREIRIVPGWFEEVERVAPTD